MAKCSKSAIFTAAAVVISLRIFQSHVFVPPPPVSRRSSVNAAVGAAGLLGAASSALANPIGSASEKFAAASYPLISQIDWVKTPVLANWLKTGAAVWDSKKVGLALKKTLDMGLAMDPALVKESVAAHKKALAAAASSEKLVTSQEGYQSVVESIASLIASAPPAPNSYGFSEIGTKSIADAWGFAGFVEKPGLNDAWYMSLKNPVAAVSTIRSFDDLQSAVGKAAGNAAAGSNAYTPDYSDNVGSSAKELADAVYPIFKEINWGSAPVLGNWFAANAGLFDAQDMSKAVNAILTLSLDLDQNSIHNAVAAHSQALGVANNQAGLVTSQAKNEAVFEAIARMLSSAPAAEVKAVFDTAEQLRVKELNAEWLKTVDSEQAAKAFEAFKKLASNIVDAQR